MKPSQTQLQEAYGKPIPDIIKKNLSVLFCGINPGLYSGATGFHFARPGNKFWKSLFLGGFTPKQLHPSEGAELLKLNLGITNLVNKTSARADELTTKDYEEGFEILKSKVNELQPKILVVLGIGAYRLGSGKPRTKIGLQEETLGKTKIWVLPNPSGLNAHFQVTDFSKSFKLIREFISS